MSDIKNIHVINSLGRISDLRGWSENFVQLDCFSWRRTRIINLATNQKGYDTFETIIGKLSARNPDLSGLFLFRHYVESYIE